MVVRPWQIHSVCIRLVNEAWKVSRSSQSTPVEAPDFRSLVVQASGAQPLCLYMCLSLPKALEPPSRVYCASEQDLEPTSTRRLTRVLHASTSFSCYSITNRALVRTPRGRIYHFFHFACLEADGHNVYFINHLWARPFCSLCSTCVSSAGTCSSLLVLSCLNSFEVSRSLQESTQASLPDPDPSLIFTPARSIFKAYTRRPNSSQHVCTPEANSTSTLRPPSARAIGSGSSLRASADMTVLTGSSSVSRIRPSSDFYGQAQQGHGQGNAENDSQDKIAQQWIADIDQYETTLEEMAAATLDQDFKDELSAIEQWFRVLSEAERTAALYALLQQTTQVQIRFFIQVLQQMGKNHPMSGVLSPANFDKDPMSNRLSDAMNKLNVDSARNSFSRNSTIASAKRNSGLDPSTINAMFPDAAAAIATEKAKFTQQTGNPPSSNRNSAAIDTRVSISGGQEARDASALNPASPWGAGAVNEPSTAKGNTSQVPMGQFVQPPPSGGLRSPRPQMAGGSTIQSTTLNAPEKNPSDLPLLSPYQSGSGNWASMVNTPMAPTFNAATTGGKQADMMANATVMKLAALSTVNNRIALDDVRKYRRARSNDAPGSAHAQVSPSSQAVNLPGTNVVMINEHGQVLSPEQVLAMQAQQSIGLGGQRSRPSSPGLAMHQTLGPVPHFTSPQHNGFLSAYDGSSGLLGTGIPAVSLGQLGMTGHEGYLSDHSDIVRGRSPRGRRGSSKAPEDPADPTLLQDIPSWLRSLRLHKYTENLRDMKWTELIELDDKALEERGVNALGARRKMLKVFEQVKEAKAEGRL